MEWPRWLCYIVVMDETHKNMISALLRRELQVATGCTEPAASALAGAQAKVVLGCMPTSVRVRASRDMVKNAMGVGLPNCEMRGICAAVALGVAGGDPQRGLGILAVVTDEQLAVATALCHDRCVVLDLAEGVPALFIEVTATAGEHTAVVTVSGEHDRISRIVKDGQVIHDIGIIPSCSGQVHDSMGKEQLCSLTLDDIIAYADDAPADIRELVLCAARTNLAIAHHSCTGEFGLSVGKIAGEEIPQHPRSLAEAFALGASLAAAASDARMAGCSMPVVINSGSGNQGITVTVPVAILAEYLGSDDQQLSRALCVSELVGLVLTARKDRLSALCGAFTAAIGTACAMVALLGGDRLVMDRAVNTMVGNLTGIVCDGAKMTCALKIYSCVEAADLATRLAFRGYAPGSESGIVGKDSLQSIGYLSRLSHEGMEQTDRTIVSIMLDKQGD